ncbi:hypothetical protein D3C79_663230 [compost metagenome]
MLQFFHVQQSAFLTQQLNDQIVGLEHEFTVQRWIGAGQVAAVRANRVGDFQAVFLADHEVIRAVARCGMYGTGTGIQRNVIAQDRRHVKAHKRMGKAHQFQIAALTVAQHCPGSDACALHHAFHQIGCQDHALAVDLH